jgi:hypothetical protein
MLAQARARSCLPPNEASRDSAGRLRKSRPRVIHRAYQIIREID